MAETWPVIFELRSPWAYGIIPSHTGWVTSTLLEETIHRTTNASSHRTLFWFDDQWKRFADVHIAKDYWLRFVSPGDLDHVRDHSEDSAM